MSEPGCLSPRLWGGWGLMPGDHRDIDSRKLEPWLTALLAGRDYVSLSLPRDVVVELLAAFVYENRQRLDLTQMELAHRACSNIRTISVLELEKQLPRMETLARLALAMGFEPLLVFLPRMVDKKE